MKVFIINLMVVFFSCSYANNQQLFDKLFYENTNAKAYKNAIKAYYLIKKTCSESAKQLTSEAAEQSTASVLFLQAAWQYLLESFYFIKISKKEKKQEVLPDAMANLYERMQQEVECVRLQPMLQPLYYAINELIATSNRLLF